MPKTKTTEPTSTLTVEQLVAEREAKAAEKRARDAEAKRAKRAAAKAAATATAEPTVEPEAVVEAAEPAPAPVVVAAPMPALTAPRLQTTDVVGRALTEGTTEIIGAVTFWSLHGILVRRDDLRIALARLGLSFACPKDPKPQACLRMAVEIVRRATTARVVFDRVLDTKTEVVYAMSSRATDEAAERAQYQHKTRVRLDKSTGALQLEDSADDVLQAVDAKYREIRDYITTTEFGLVLINALRGRRHQPGLSAVNLRGETGGVYFVPAPNVVRLNALADLVDLVGGRGAITVWPIPKGARTITQATEAARVDFGERILAVRKDVEALLNDIDADDEIDPQGRRVLARAKAFAGLKARAEAFGDILGDMKGELEAQVRELRAKIEQRIGAAMGDDFDATDDDDDAEEGAEATVQAAE